MIDTNLIESFIEFLDKELQNKDLMYFSPISDMGGPSRYDTYKKMRGYLKSYLPKDFELNSEKKVKSSMANVMSAQMACVNAQTELEDK